MACQRSTNPSQKALSLALRAEAARRRHSIGTAPEFVVRSSLSGFHGEVFIDHAGFIRTKSEHSQERTLWSV
jgi:hypothetical protein